CHVDQRPRRPLAGTDSICVICGLAASRQQDDGRTGLLLNAALLNAASERRAGQPLNTSTPSAQDARIRRLTHGSSLKGVGKSEFGGGLAIAQGGSRLA